MRIGILGTGGVGRALAGRWLRAGHEVALGGRSKQPVAGVEWHGTLDAELRDRAAVGSFADAAAAGEVVVNATPGQHSLAALATVARDDLSGVLVDVANPLDGSAGGLPVLAVPGGGPAGSDSLAETIQRTHPNALVVKALNTVNAQVMVDPASFGGGDHTLPIAGDDESAKAVARSLLGDLGWKPEQLLDLGGLDAARGMEAYLMLWLRLMLATGTAAVTTKVVRP